MFGNREGDITFADFKILLRYLSSWTVVYQTYAGLNTISNVKEEETKADPKWKWSQAFEALNLAGERGVLFYGNEKLYNYLREIYGLQSGPVSFNQFIICASNIRLIYGEVCFRHFLAIHNIPILPSHPQTNSVRLIILGNSESRNISKRRERRKAIKPME